MDFGPFISAGKVVVQFRKKLTPANLIGLIDDGWLAVRAYFIREWYDPTWDYQLDVLASHEHVADRNEWRRKERVALNALAEKSVLVDSPLPQDELAALQNEIAEIEKEIENCRFITEMESIDIHEDVLRSLRDGTVLAKGFLSPHVARRRPVIIPPHEWAILELDTNERSNAKAVGAGIEYIGVKLAWRTKRQGATT
jgi:hypothetical protein